MLLCNFQLHYIDRAICSLSQTSRLRMNIAIKIEYSFVKFNDGSNASDGSNQNSVC